MLWSEILRRSTDQRFYGSRLTSDPRLGSAYGMRHRTRSLLSGLNCEEDHGPWPMIESPDILVLGCSVTASQNLPRRYSWPDIIRQIDGQSVNSLARTASSIVRQIAGAQMSLDLYGYPRRVLALLPNVDRAWLPFLEPTEQSARLSFMDALYMPDEVRYLVIGEHRVGRTERSLRAIHMTDPSQTVAYTHQILDLWTRLCHAIGADLVISSWHGPTNDTLREHYPSHVMPTYDADPEADWRIDGRWGSASDASCGHEPQTDDQTRYWLRADDDLHPGLHHHLHFYETLTGRQISNEQIALL